MTLGSISLLLLAAAFWLHIFFYIVPIISLTAVLFGTAAMRQTRRWPSYIKGKRWAGAGLTAGAIALAADVLVLVAGFTFGSFG